METPFEKTQMPRAGELVPYLTVNCTVVVRVAEPEVALMVTV